MRKRPADFDAENWLARLKAAGGGLRVAAMTMLPVKDRPSDECRAIWDEIRGDAEKWRAVEKLVRWRSAGVVGWTDI
jgi:hypothetical protein